MGTLKSMTKEKSPWPSGCLTELFLHFQDIMLRELIELVEESRSKCKISGVTNVMFVALIPNTEKPSTFFDFRLISLCNTTYKMISKIIASRLKATLSRHVTLEQFGFFGQLTDTWCGYNHSSVSTFHIFSIGGKHHEDATGLKHGCITEKRTNDRRNAVP